MHVAHACASMDRCLGGPTPGGPPHPTWGHITSRPHPGVCTVPGAKVWSDHSPPGRETEARGGWAGPSPLPTRGPGWGGGRGSPGCPALTSVPVGVVPGCPSRPPPRTPAPVSSPSPPSSVLSPLPRPVPPPHPHPTTANPPGEGTGAATACPHPPPPLPPPRRGGGGGGTPGTGVPRPHHGQGPGPTAGGRPGGGREGVGTTAGPVGGGSRPPPSLYLLAALVVGEGGEAGARLHREQHFPEREGPGRAGSQAGPRLTSRPGASLESGLAPRTPGPNAGDGPAPVGVHRAGFPSPPPPPPLHSASTPGCGAGGFSRGRTPHTVGRLVRRPPPPVLPLAPPQGETPSPGPGWTLPRCPSQDVAGVCVCA